MNTPQPLAASKIADIYWPLWHRVPEAKPTVRDWDATADEYAVAALCFCAAINWLTGQFVGITIQKMADVEQYRCDASDWGWPDQRRSKLREHRYYAKTMHEAIVGVCLAVKGAE